MKIKSRPWLVPCLYPTISRISDRHWYCQSSPALSSPCRNQLRLKIQVIGNTLKTKENSGIILHQPFLKSSEKNSCVGPAGQCTFPHNSMEYTMNIYFSDLYWFLSSVWSGSLKVCIWVFCTYACFGNNYCHLVVSVSVPIIVQQLSIWWSFDRGLDWARIQDLGCYCLINNYKHLLAVTGFHVEQFHVHSDN